jgi:hypothetical protein
MPQNQVGGRVDRGGWRNWTAKQAGQRQSAGEQQCSLNQFPGVKHGGSDVRGGAKCPRLD